MNKIIIAIDGFSSCGKSTMAKDLARKIGYIYIDSGAIYRAITLLCMRQGMIDQNRNLDIANLEKMLASVKIEFRINKETDLSETFLNNENVEKEIRSMDVSNNVSMISSYPIVRNYTDSLLHKMSEKKGVVMDGRDIGTSVFPQAELKIFVTADPKIRAQRRLDELINKGDKTISFAEVLQNIEERDYLDQNRKESPLKKADDAVVLDNSYLTKEEQMQWLLNKFNEKVDKNE